MESEQKTLLILKAQPQALGPVEGFLVNRGWSVKATSSVKEAMLFLAQNQPAYFLVSIDHPQAQKLPRIVAQAVPVCVIAFAETNSIDSLTRLNQSGVTYTIPAPMTGPAVERAINKYLKEAHGHAKDMSGGTWKNSASSSESINVIGGENQNSDFQFEQFLSQFFDGAAGIPMVPRSENFNGWIPQEPGRKKLPLQDSLISKCARQALDTACAPISESQTKPLSFVNQAYCVLIRSARFSGYLVMACPSGSVSRRHILQDIHAALMKLMSEHGEPTSHNQALHIRLNKVHFTDWALNDADFVHSADHNDQEIAMAFFQRLDLQHGQIFDDSEPMLAIDLHEVDENTVLQFNLYIHLEKNQKFLRYVRRGLSLATDQKQRLIQQGLERFHILNMEAAAFAHYRVERFLNRKIDNYHSSQLN